MPGSASNSPQYAPGTRSLGTMYPGGGFVIESNSLASPTVVTTLAPHGLVSGDTIFWTASTTSNPLLTATPQTVVTVLSATTFSLVGINCSTGGTAGSYDIAVTAIPVTASGVPATITTGSAHGLRIGDVVTLVATGASAVVGGSLDTAITVTAVPTATTFVAGAFTNVNVAGSATAGHYTKTTFYSDWWDTGNDPDYVGLVISSVIGHATVSTLVDIQGSFDGTNWFNVGYATMAAPQTVTFAQLTITTATATSYKIVGPGEISYVAYKFLRLKFSTNSNIIVQATLNALPAV
jgi:hypothetical protein